MHVGKNVVIAVLSFVVMHKFTFYFIPTKRNQPTCGLRKMLNELKSEHLFMSSGLSTLQIILSVSELYLQQS